jgi:addiction module HigA family antidote
MHNPPHPGEFIMSAFLEPLGVSGRELAGQLRISPTVIQRLLSGSRRLSPEMALRLSVVLGRTPESWLALQNSYDLWVARQKVDFDDFEPLVVGGSNS